MPIAANSPDSEQEIRWRAWQEKGRRADRLADKRMKVLLTIIGLILLALILYNTLRAGVVPISDDVQNTVGSDHFNSYRMAIFRKDPGILSAVGDTIAA
jgi:hypothetical protein